MKEKKPILSDEFLDELAEEINLLYGEPREETEEGTSNGRKPWPVV